jgi:hypothetical protein
MKYICFPILILLAIAPPLRAQDVDSKNAPSAAIEALLELQKLDQRLHRIGYQLLEANAPFCRYKIPNSGILLHDIQQYGDKSAARSAFDFSQDIAINSLIAGSISAQAGLLVNDGILAINDNIVRQFSNDPSGSGKEGDGRLRISRFKTLLEQNTLEIMVLRNGQQNIVNLKPQPSCASRFEIEPSIKRGASADGQVVKLTSTLAAYFESDDEFAAVVAHEIAHNLLKHKDILNAQKVNRGFFGQFGKSTKLIKKTEIAADRLSVWLMANAGYDPQAAIRFWTRYGKEHGKGIFSASTHYRWKKRVGLFEEEIAKINATEARQGKRSPPLLMSDR